MKILRTVLLFVSLWGCMLPAAAGDDGRGARLEFEVAEHDFGDIKQKGGDVSFEFRYTNKGDAPLVITRIVTSCSCTKADYGKRPVAPGQSGVVKITYEPGKKELGVFYKAIQVFTNDPAGRQVIVIKGRAVK